MAAAMTRSVARIERGGVRLVGSLAGPVRFGFTERTGGVSQAPYASLNLGTHVGDDARAVAENRRRALDALDAGAYADALLVPNQVHGDHVAIVDRADDASLEQVRVEIAAGADAIVCVVPRVPVLLCYADCAPVILICPGGFAVVHSGWKGTYAGIAGTAARALADAAGCAPAEVSAYLGPHIRGDEYEVSRELIERFIERFGPAVASAGPRLLDLSVAIRASLVAAGVGEDAIVDTGCSTMSELDRFFSYRAEGGVCGRHGALAVMA